ncbi:hypothetical protein JA1_001804 [Spathaspora sp. JA1]|nr:hypothetical protein JA1_001804 [Spathaspora sp. JA1]
MSTNSPFSHPWWGQYSWVGPSARCLDEWLIMEESPEFDKVIDVKSFENLKVVVKLTDIQLTPENPRYESGSWNVEGRINEDIVATVLYYYDMDNVSQCKLSFRTAFEDPVCEQGAEVVIFPNMYQSRIDSFELKDKTKPGYCKILSFFIVDPYNTNVISTDKVPPQQQEWWDDEELNYLYPGNTKEVILQLKQGGAWPMSLEEAKRVRRTY